MAPALLILLGAAAILRADGTPDDVSLLPPVNFTIKVTGLAQVLLSWKPNPEQERKGVQLGYHLRVHTPQDDDFELKHTGRRYEAALHRGFSASVRTILWERRPSPASRWVSAELRAPPGSPGTSAVNLTCVTNTAAGGHPESRPYRVSLRCAWRAGEEAPSDTQYFLYYRYGSRTEACREYGQDALRRNVACWFPATSIDGKGQDALAVGVSGSSLRAAIRPYDRLFALHEIGQDEQKPWTEWLLIPLTASLCAAFVCSLSRRTGHVCTKLFPPVPGPKSDIGDLVATVNYEKGGSGETESDVLSYVAVDEEPEVLEDLVF
ncbi:interleukin 5 receptor subunit alpha [Phyllostomus discolor]|uniref:Interleukin 5 receptor subunit alpha n=1 Tax=Phyllostomus discolor TaxID=89673 RepID=A0A833ZTD7_9CHIR|nr:interleukin 5 receptor subunit alpha [Phyllostomus discolor]